MHLKVNYGITYSSGENSLTAKIFNIDPIKV